MKKKIIIIKEVHKLNRSSKLPIYLARSLFNLCLSGKARGLCEILNKLFLRADNELVKISFPIVSLEKSY